MEIAESSHTTGSLESSRLPPLLSQHAQSPQELVCGLFRPGSSFHVTLNTGSYSSSDPLRSDCPLNQVVHTKTPKRTSVHIQIEPDEFYNENGSHKNTFTDLDIFQNNKSIEYHENYNLEDDSSCNNVNDCLLMNHDSIKLSDDLSDNLPLIETKSLEVKPSVSSFLTMENSSNAIDNNIHASASCLPLLNNIAGNHIFKLPSKELSFNGTLKHLQKSDPNLNCRTELEDSKYVILKDDNLDDVVYKSSDELTSNCSSPGVSTGSSKCDVTVYSSASQFPSDCELISTNVASKTQSSNSNNATTACVKNFTFSGAVSPLKAARMAPSTSSHNRSGESLDSSYNSGPQSPNMFSDDEDCNEEKLRRQKTDFVLKQYEKCDRYLKRRLERTLGGVPPPPSVTISQLTIPEILRLYQQNLATFHTPSDASRPPDPEASSDSVLGDCSVTGSLEMALEDTRSRGEDRRETKSRQAKGYSFTHVNGSEEAAMEEGWPELLQCKYYGVHYNCTSQSEQLDSLLVRYTSRYVGCETASSWSVGGGLGQRPRAARAPVQSPGRRLSHLARRRTTLCSAASFTSTAAATRQILIDRRKFTRTNLTAALRKSPRLRNTPNKRTPGRRTPGKKTPAKKTPGKKTPAKKTPGSSQKKRAVKKLQLGSEQITKSMPTRESSKRALFLSPETTLEAKKVECKSVSEKPSTSRVPLRSKRVLFGSPGRSDSSNDGETRSQDGLFHSNDGFLSRKRDRLDDSVVSDTEGNVQKCKMAKSLSFGGDKITDCSASAVKVGLVRRASEYTPGIGFHSDLNKKKLLWAVAEALRAHSIGVTHPDFRRHATPLARLTRKLCCMPTHARPPGTSTSDTLLRIARLHAFSVIRGRTVEDLIQEEQSKQIPSKITGYVPIGADPLACKAHQTTKNSENSYGEVRNFKTEPSATKPGVLQDKVVNINSNSNSFVEAAPEIKKSTFFKDNSILKARRQISFDHIDEPSNR